MAVLCGSSLAKFSRMIAKTFLLISETNFLAVTAKPQTHLQSLQSKKGLFAGPKNAEANLWFEERAQLQRMQVFCSLHIGVAMSYFERTKPQPKTHGLMSV